MICRRFGNHVPRLDFPDLIEPRNQQWIENVPFGAVFQIHVRLINRTGREIVVAAVCDWQCASALYRESQATRHSGKESGNAADPPADMRRHHEQGSLDCEIILDR